MVGTALTRLCPPYKNPSTAGAAASSDLPDESSPPLKNISPFQKRKSTL
jgi:hypothetical protein